MGSVIPFRRARPARLGRDKDTRHEQPPESRLPLIIFIGSFSAAALAMTIAVVVEAADTWRSSIGLLAVVFVIALTKIILANALFFVMMRSDSANEAAPGKSTARPSSAWRRPVKPGFSRSLAGSAAGIGANDAESAAKLTSLERRSGPKTHSPRRT